MTVLKLIWGDDPAAVGEPVRAVVDGADGTGEILARTGGLFGSGSVLVLNAETVDTEAVPGLAAHDIVLRIYGRAPAKLITAVRSAGGEVHERKLPRDAGRSAAAQATLRGISLSSAGRRAVAKVCGTDDLWARSIVDSCAVAGVNEIGAQQVERLSGGGGDRAAVAEITSAVLRGRREAALEALGRSDTDPHALLGALRRKLGERQENPAGVAALMLDTERRLRSSSGRRCAMWICVSRLSSAFA